MTDDRNGVCGVSGSKKISSVLDNPAPMIMMILVTVVLECVLFSVSDNSLCVHCSCALMIFVFTIICKCMFFKYVPAPAEYEALSCLSLFSPCVSFLYTQNSGMSNGD